MGLVLGFDNSNIVFKVYLSLSLALSLSIHIYRERVCERERYRQTESERGVCVEVSLFINFIKVILKIVETEILKGAQSSP